MVKKLIGSDDMWRKFQFYGICTLLGLAISGIGIMTVDHFTLKQHLDSSNYINTLQSNEIKDLGKNLDKLIDHLNIYANAKDKNEAVIENDISTIKGDIDDLKDKVRGNSVSFNIRDDKPVPMFN